MVDPRALAPLQDVNMLASVSDTCLRKLIDATLWRILRRPTRLRPLHRSRLAYDDDTDPPFADAVMTA